VNKDFHICSLGVSVGLFTAGPCVCLLGVLLTTASADNVRCGRGASATERWR